MPVEKETNESAEEAQVSAAEQAAPSDQPIEETELIPEVTLVMPKFSEEIDRLDEMVQSVAEDPASTMTGLEEVQIGLIENLDRLNKYIEDYVEVLGNSRKKAS